ncbi:DUF1806 family protein [Bacillus horti]|uniref:DUF1806 family protein n=1 Tax=Caldalkalibacillus horti TaxID=77523 RepID=A0ABT9VVM4_9BACI|nr:DUF1806 family protein [Bacillus horti]MDQ0165028.1 hypothetical protein [Bacillus horti]
MKAIDKQVIQERLDRFQGVEAYIHLETTNGAYASHRFNMPNVGVFVRNAKVRVQQAKIQGAGSYRVGVQIETGWIYAEGITSYDEHKEQLLLYGFDDKGKLAVALQLSQQPFGEEAL